MGQEKSHLRVQLNHNIPVSVWIAFGEIKLGFEMERADSLSPRNGSEMHSQLKLAEALIKHLEGVYLHMLMALLFVLQN